MDQFYGVFYPFSLNDTRGLQNQDIIIRKAQIGAQILGVVIRLRGWCFKIEHVGDQAVDFPVDI